MAINGLSLARVEKFDLLKSAYKASGITLLRLGLDVSMKKGLQWPNTFFWPFSLVFL